MSNQKVYIPIAKWLDEYIGSLLIVLLLGLKKLFLRDRKPASQIRKILFIKFWGLGSIILSEPALRRIKELYPDARIHFLTFKENQGLFRLLPIVDRVIPLSFRNPFWFLLEYILILKRLRAEGYDIVYDAEFFSHCSAILAGITGSPRIVGFARNRGLKRRLLTERRRFTDDIHASKQFVSLIDLHTDDKYSIPRLTLASDSGPQNLFVASRFVRPYIVININSGVLALERRWSSNSFVALAKELLKRFDFDLVFSGTAHENDYVNSAVKKCGDSNRVHNIAGECSFIEFADIVSKAVLVISNDSCPVHLASALDIPVVAIYGPESPTLYGPLARKQQVFYLNLWCSPCMSIENAKTIDCINNLSCIKGLSASYVSAETSKFIIRNILISTVNRGANVKKEIASS